MYCIGTPKFVKIGFEGVWPNTLNIGLNTFLFSC